MPLPRITSTRNFMGISLEKARLWAPSVVGFGALAGTAGLYFAEGIPIFRKDILSRIPLVGAYWRNQLEEAEQ
ncbi:MAG: cytochrome b-c1 complex subunit 10 [Piptocephalis tieghemiana]|nr:MAG: cytochrome b-c1 complex subunit 10 [Piptocephalis tieghemiana]